MIFLENLLLLVIAVLLVVIACLILGTTHRGGKHTSSNMWLEKLSSRKLWAAVGVFITGITTAFHVESLTETQVEAICYSISGFLAFIVAEGYADGHSPTNKIDEIAIEQKKEDTYE